MSEDPFLAIAERLQVQRADIERRIAEITAAEAETEQLLELVQRLHQRLTHSSAQQPDSD